MAQGSFTTDLNTAFERAKRFLLEDLWRLDLRPRSITAFTLRLLQFSMMVGRGFVQDKLLLRASGLTYVTTLSLIPLLVVVVALVGLVGGRETLVDGLVEQLTAVSPQAKDIILHQVDSTKIGSLGVVGGSLLLVTAILALRHLESTLNDIWGVRRSRSWSRRFADYLAVLFVAPILTVVAVSLGTTLQDATLTTRLLEMPFFQLFYQSGLNHVPQVLLIFCFAFLYWFFPNTNVKLSSALLGALVASLLFTGARYVYVDFSVGAARYSVLFGSLVALPLVLTWLYVCWAVILFGAEIAFAHQNFSHYRREVRLPAPQAAEREAMGLRVMLEVGHAFKVRESPPTAAGLSELLDAPVRTLRALLDELESAALIVACAGKDPDDGFLPSRPLSDISVADILRGLRGSTRFLESQTGLGANRNWANHPIVKRVFSEIDASLGDLADALSLAALLED